MLIADHLKQVHESIIACEKRFARIPASVQLLAVSKTQGMAAIRTAYDAGQYHFGENYVQEALPKITALANLESIQWHFIGAMQSNKIKSIARYFSWVHTLENLVQAQKLSAHRPQDLPALNVCLQIKIDHEVSKAGLSLEQLPDLAREVALLPNLRLRGLMVIPAPRTDFSAQRQPFAKLRQALQALQEKGLSLDTLSMGMSEDYAAAIAEGATWIRLGRAIFGARN